jgi:hypothetical protein
MLHKVETVRASLRDAAARAGYDLLDPSVAEVARKTAFQPAGEAAE